MNRPLPRPSTRILAPLALALCGALPCRADVTLPSLISDNMVLQQKARINVWGKAEPGETIAVQLGPETAHVTAGRDGNWGAKLGGLKSGGPYDMTVSGKNTIIIRNVAVGEVWVCAGESNMEYKVVAAHNGLAEMADATLPMVRVFIVKHDAAESPQSDCEGAWTVCDPDTVKNFTAIGFFFARELNREMRMPVGLIESAWGPSPAESWTPRDALDKNPALHEPLDRYHKATDDYPAAFSAYQAKLAQWKTDSETAKAAGSPPPRAPMAPLPPGGPREPSALYNAMISPLLRYPIRGVLWYQGESNAYGPMVYRKLFPALIGAWRDAWNEGDFPFFYVQLSGFLGRHAQPADSRWAELREAQAMALSTSHTGMAVSIDVGEEGNMHPPEKQAIAHRLALIAENQTYGKAGAVYSGPVFSGMALKDGKALLSFAHTEGGLVARNGPQLKGFSIAGDDRKFVWADAEIHGGQVAVSSKSVPKPAAVRYAWADFPDASLFNGANLPAAPFRSDAWVAGEAQPASSPTPSASPSPSPRKGKRHKQPKQ